MPFYLYVNIPWPSALCCPILPTIIIGDFSHEDEEPFLKTLLEAGKKFNLKAGKLREKKAQKRARYVKEYERSMQEEGVLEGDEAYVYWDDDAVPSLPFDEIDAEIEV